MIDENKGLILLTRMDDSSAIRLVAKPPAGHHPCVVCQAELVCGPEAQKRIMDGTGQPICLKCVPQDTVIVNAPTVGSFDDMVKALREKKN